MALEFLATHNDEHTQLISPPILSCKSSTSIKDAPPAPSRPKCLHYARWVAFENVGGSGSPANGLSRSNHTGVTVQTNRAISCSHPRTLELSTLCPPSCFLGTQPGTNPQRLPTTPRVPLAQDTVTSCTQVSKQDLPTLVTSQCGANAPMIPGFSGLRTKLKRSGNFLRTKNVSIHVDITPDTHRMRPTSRDAIQSQPESQQPRGHLRQFKA